jgi:hypothetical protein
MPSDGSFIVKFDGPGLAGGAMDVQELAVALLGLSDVVDEAAAVTFGQEARVGLRVSSGFRRGSFIVDLEVVSQLHADFVRLMSQPAVVAWAQLLALLGFSATSLIDVVRWLRGKKPRKVVANRDEDEVEITASDGRRRRVPTRTWKLVTSSKARSGLARLVRPLRKPEVDTVELRRSDGDAVQIGKDEVDAFSVPLDHDGELVVESERLVKVIRVSFVKGQKWRVAEGTPKYNVSVLDDEFFDKVVSGALRIGSQDLFRVILRSRQWYEGEQVKASFEIVKVIDHIPRESQKDLPFPKAGG